MTAPLDMPCAPAEVNVEHRLLSVCIPFATPDAPLFMSSVCDYTSRVPLSNAPHPPERLLTISQLESLPEELLQLIVWYLPVPALRNTALVSTTLNRHATDVLWQNVCLVDQWRLHPDADPEPLIEDTRGLGQSDEHDDSPIIQKLLILATYVPRPSCLF
jgi:hypothetical protein